MPPKVKAEQPSEDFEPPFYEATSTIFFHHPNGETQSVRAYNKGDRVPPDIVHAHKLGAQVKIPDVFAGQLPSPSDHIAPPAESPLVDGSIAVDTAGKE